MNENLDLPDQQTIALQCSVDGQTTTGSADRRDLSQSERWRRAGKVFGLAFLVAFFTIFIPVLHFILPPLILLGGCVISFTTYMENSEVLKGEIPCPNCAKAITLTRESEEWPKTVRCPGCAYTLQIERR